MFGSSRPLCDACGAFVEHGRVFCESCETADTPEAESSHDEDGNDVLTRLHRNRSELRDMLAVPALIVIAAAFVFEFLVGVSILDAISGFLERNVR